MRIAVAVLGVQANSAQQVGHPVHHFAALLAVNTKGFTHDVVDRHLGVQRGIRVLKDDLQVTPNRAHLLGAQRGEFLTLVAH